MTTHVKIDISIKQLMEGKGHGLLGEQLMGRMSFDDLGPGLWCHCQVWGLGEINQSVN